jgi:hypothetical protein
LGLARIEIQTASGSSNSEMTLEGLEDAEAMRDFLYSRMRGTHQASIIPAEDSLPGLLREIAVELREIRLQVERSRGRVAT